MEKTPVPTDPNIIGVGVMGSSHLAEIFPEMCTCGIRISHLSYPAGVEVAEGHANGISSAKAIVNFMNKHELKICCRNSIISPIVNTVVSADIGARRIENGRFDVNISDAPTAITSLQNILPPPVLTGGETAEETCTSTGFVSGVVTAWGENDY